MAFDPLPVPGTLFDQQIGLNSAASSSGTIALANVEFIRGAFKVYASQSILDSISPAQFQDGQIIYVEHEKKLFRMDVTPGSLDPTSFIFTPATKTSSSFNWPDSIITASVVGSTMTFTKGDGDTFDVALPSGGGGSGIFKQVGSTDVFAATSSLQISGSTLLSSPLTETGSSVTASNAGTGGGVSKYALVTSESAWHYNTNVGVPTSEGWKTGLDGSYFNRFDQNTDTSEILRFMAGLLKDQAPDSSPNTRTWNGVSTSYSGQNSSTTRDTLFTGVLGNETSRLSQHWTASSYIDFSKTGSYKEAQEYFIAKGFMSNSDRGAFGNDTGTNPFSNGYGNFPSSNIITSGEFSQLTFSNSSQVTGDTTVSSSNSQGTSLFGMGELNGTNAREISVQIIASQSYSDNASNTNPDETSNNFHTSSAIIYTQNQFGTSADGLRLGKIVPDNPLITSQYQDGLFQNVDGPITGRFYTGGATNSNSISSSGYYIMHGVKVGLKTGSMSNFEYKNGSDSSTSRKFYMPNPTNGSYTSQGAIQQINTGAPSPIILSDVLTRTAFTATSRSLSGAPYLLTTTYNFTYNASVSRSFDPAYTSNVSPITISLTDEDTWENVGSTTPSSPLSVSINTQGINSNTANAGVFPQGGNPSNRRSVGTIPHLSDISYISSSLSFTLDSNRNNITSNTWNTATNYNLKFSTTGRNWSNSSPITSQTTRQLLYDAALFGQPVSSGSMAIYSYTQGYDAGQETSTSGGVLSEQFSGEDFRVKINSNTLNGTYAAADKFTTNTYAVNNLTDIDFQVRPGRLVVPGSTYGYWLPTIGSSNYKYYARAFNSTGFSGLPAKSFTLNVGKQFQNLKRWYEDVNDDGFSIGIIFESGTNPSTGNKILIDLLDYTSLNNSFNNITPQAGLNPFGTAIDIFTNNNSTSPSSPSSTNLPLSTSLTKFTQITNVLPSFIVCIRGNNVSNDFIQQISIQLSSS